MEEFKYQCKTAHPLTYRPFFYIGLIVDSCLDEDILRDKAAELIKANPTLGGRLIPSTRPWTLSTGSNVDFSSRQVDQDVSHLFKHYDTTNVNFEPKAMHSLDMKDLDSMFLFDLPKKLENLFSIRATILRDATILCFGFSHHFADATAGYNIIKAYCNLLANRPSTSFILPPDAQGTGLSETMIEKETNSSIAPVGYQDHRDNFSTGFWPIFMILVGVLWNSFLRATGWRERLEERFVYIPGDWVKMLRKQALETLPAGESEPTKNNIVCAWYLKSLYGPVRADEPVEFYQPVNYRAWIRPPPEGKYWVHNSIGVLRDRLSTTQIRSLSVGALASKLRHITMQYTQPSAIESYLRFAEDRSANRQLPSIRGSGNMPLLMITPWTGLDFSELDFSGAAVDGQKTNVVFVNPMVRNMRDGVWPSAITIKSPDGGGYWMRGWNTASGWRGFNQAMDFGALVR